MVLHVGIPSAFDPETMKTSSVTGRLTSLDFKLQKQTQTPSSL